MVRDSVGRHTSGLFPEGVGWVRTLQDLGLLLRRLRREQARRAGDTELTYRELATRTGWSVAAIGGYFSGATLPPTDRFDVLVRLLGATAAEQGLLATARDAVEERRRDGAPAPRPAPAGQRPAGQPPAGADLPVPRQLPIEVPGFVGRAAQQAELDALPDPDGPRCAVVSGTAGVGKTALVLHWAHRMAERFPGGQLYVNLGGFGPATSALDPGDVLRSFLEALGVPPQRIPPGLDARAAWYRSVVAGRQVLVVLDNARDADQVRPLLPGCSGCVAVVTSRHRLVGLSAREGARHLVLDLLEPTEAVDLLVARLGAARVAREPQAIDQIVARCARLPLALAIVAARAAAHPALPLGRLVDDLAAATGGLDALDTGDPATDARAVLSWSYRALSPAAARLFRLVGLHPGPDLSGPAAASLAGALPREVRSPLAELTDAHLLTEHLPGRYSHHDLLHAYATELALADDRPAERRAALRRTLDHYLHTAAPAASLLHPLRGVTALPAPEPDTTAEVLADAADAMAWFDAEHRVLLAAVRRAGDVGMDERTCGLAWALAPFLDQRGHWHDQVGIQTAALLAAQRMSDPASVARAHRFLANAHTRLGSTETALEHTTSALAVYVDMGERTGQAHTHRSLAWLLDRMGRTAEAVRHAQRSLDMFTELGDRGGQASALNATGWYHLELGDAELALAYCQRALALLRDLGDPGGEAATWDSVGHAYHYLADHRQAIVCHSIALEMNRALGDRYHEATVLTHLGQARHAAGDEGAARADLHRALDILDELGHSDADEVRATLAHLDRDGAPSRPPRR